MYATRLMPSSGQPTKESNSAPREGIREKFYELPNGQNDDEERGNEMTYFLSRLTYCPIVLTNK